jgi:signal transduction histidine kinase
VLACLGLPSLPIVVRGDRFQQVDASDSRDKGGTGLGLAICRTIVDQQSGTIWAESRVGDGATFVVALPAASGMHGALTSTDWSEAAHAA